MFFFNPQNAPNENLNQFFIMVYLDEKCIYKIKKWPNMLQNIPKTNYIKKYIQNLYSTQAESILYSMPYLKTKSVKNENIE